MSNKAIEEVIRIANDNILALSEIGTPKLSIDRANLLMCFTKISKLLTGEVEGVEVSTTISKIDNKTLKYYCGSCDFMVIKGEDDDCRHCRHPIKWPKDKANV